MYLSSLVDTADNRREEEEAIAGFRAEQAERLIRKADSPVVAIESLLSNNSSNGTSGFENERRKRVVENVPSSTATSSSRPLSFSILAKSMESGAGDKEEIPYSSSPYKKAKLEERVVEGYSDDEEGGSSSANATDGRSIKDIDSDD